MIKSSSFTIFNPMTGKVVGETSDQLKADYVNATYTGVMKALPFSEFLDHCDKLRANGNESPYL